MSYLHEFDNDYRSEEDSDYIPSDSSEEEDESEEEGETGEEDEPEGERQV